MRVGTLRKEGAKDVNAPHSSWKRRICGRGLLNESGCNATFRNDLKMSSKDSVSLLKWMMKKAKEKAAMRMIMMIMVIAMIMMIRKIMMITVIMTMMMIMIMMIMMTPAMRMMKPKAALTILLVME